MVTQAAEAEPSSGSTAPQNFRRIVKELRLYKTLACMSGRNMRKKYKKPAKFDKKQKVLDNLNKNFRNIHLIKDLKNDWRRKTIWI
jgi:hypothetical protein